MNLTNIMASINLNNLNAKQATHCNFCEIDGDQKEIHSHSTENHNCRSCKRANKRYFLNLVTTGHSASSHTVCVRCNKRGHFVDNCPLTQDIKKKKLLFCTLCERDGDPRTAHGHVDKDHECKDCRQAYRIGKEVDYLGHSAADHITCVVCNKTGHRSKNCSEF
jgi:hypothetical protein